MVQRLTVLALLTIAVAVSGCTDRVALKCPKWLERTMPIKPSRADVLTRGTQDQIVTANESWQEHCK